MIKLNTIEYLSAIAGKQPNGWFGIGFDGERLGVVAYSLVDSVIDGENQQVALVWYADRFENCGMSKAMRTLDQLAGAAFNCPISQVPIIAKGQKKGLWTFRREAEKNFGAKIIEFEKKSYGRFTPEEVVMSVKDDISEGLIRPAPEFKGRPEFEDLNASLRNLKLTDDLDVVAEAAIYGFGLWSASGRRNKYATRFTSNPFVH